MVIRFILPVLFLNLLNFSLKAQKINNIYEDAIALRKLCEKDSSGNYQLNVNEYEKWKAILKEYAPLKDDVEYESFLSSFHGNPFQMDELLPKTLPHFLKSQNLSEVVVVSLSHSFVIPSKGRISSAGTIGTAQIADALTKLVIKRGKEELTATFFEQFKKQLKQYPELKAAFPKTAEFIDQIETYLYASYLTTLREGFHEDVYNLPFNLGFILRSERMKNYMFKKPKNGNVWLAIPILCFLGDIRQNKSIADAIKNLDPDPELQSVNLNYFYILKLVVLLSESIRDKTGAGNWVKPEDLKSNIFADQVTSQIFFGLLYQSVKDYGDLEKFITVANATKIKTQLLQFKTLFDNTKEAADEIKKQMSEEGKPVQLTQLLKLINSSVKNLQPIFDDLKALTFDHNEPPVNTALFFETIPRITTIVSNLNDKRYALGVMNSMILINQFVSKDAVVLTPFTSTRFLDTESEENSNVTHFFREAINQLKLYTVTHPDDDINTYIEKLEKIAKDKDYDRQELELNRLIKKLVKHKYKLDGSIIYQNLLKYGSMMAALSEAKTTEDVSTALEAAILPVGSSSLKYYTSFSFSINSYIGGASYDEYYNTASPGARYTLKTLGAALPIGINFSKSTRWGTVGSISLFVSLVDLGALASYRLSSPPNVTSNDLPDFTLQNIIAPGGFLVFGRLFKTPLAIGLGVQNGPQLRKISVDNVDISQYQNWRLGAFLSVDIPFFNLYSKSLRRPLE